MNTLLASLLLVLLGTAARPATAQTDAAPSPEARAVIEATQRFFDAMAARDSTALQALLHPSAQIVGVDPQGRVGVQPGGRDAWIRDVAHSAEALRERMWTPRVEVDGPLATLWARYDFHVDDRFSHCGTDAFQFVREPAAAPAWRLVVVTFTMQTEGCEAARESTP